MGMGPIDNNGRKKLVADINVTPLVDVMLVLLIIFMVTAPMMTQGLDVDLPETTTKALRQKEDPIIVTVSKSGVITIGQQPVSPKSFAQDMAKLHSLDSEKQVFLKADKAVAYGVVVSLMADIKSAGFDKLGMITQPADEKK